MTKRKQFFDIFANILKIKNINTYLHNPFAMRLKMELRSILFPVIILEMFLQLERSPPVVNSIDWT
jgi:hypothetical protein